MTDDDARRLFSVLFVVATLLAIVGAGLDYQSFLKGGLPLDGLDGNHHALRWTAFAFVTCSTFFSGAALIHAFKSAKNWKSFAALADKPAVIFIATFILAISSPFAAN